MNREHLLLAAARFGYAARGAVYLLTGVIAVLASVEWRPRSSGTAGAIAAVGELPLGQVWLIAAGAGLACFAAWRLVEAIFDPERNGHDRKAILGRLGKASEGIVHLGLAATALQLLGAFEDLNEEGDAHREAAQVLTLPHGQWLLWAVAAGVLAAAVSNGWKALNDDFRDGVVCPPRMRPVVDWSGRFGHLAMGLVLALLAAFLAVAAFDQDPTAAKSIGGALQALEARPFGSTMMATLGAGFMLFGLYGLLEACFRRLRVPEPLA